MRDHTSGAGALANALCSSSCCAVLVLVLCCALNGCFGVYGTVQIGPPLPAEKLARIVPGTTTLKDVLSSLGPPDYIIDGSKSIIDEARFWAEMPTVGELQTRRVPTRQLRAPGDAVILVYSSSTREGGSALLLSGGVVQAREDYVSARPGEVFVFISKERQVVLAVADGGAVQK